jgi:hypothetical protein
MTGWILNEEYCGNKKNGGDEIYTQIPETCSEFEPAITGFPEQDHVECFHSSGF